MLEDFSGVYYKGSGVTSNTLSRFVDYRAGTDGSVAD